ncbi:MAG TPA: acyltransferase [Usitatibacter sp.]|jgi:peptidoglycan/LPS O-acetylase OafA/YrhL|nr:acyltransferase [Usitatibacter sp.]
MKTFYCYCRIPELDGLRAVAVSAVVAYHLAPAYIPGGFLGVDLFFVLSGFLITSLLLDEEARTGTISIRDFYLRRALRILPPLATAIVLSLALDVASVKAAAAAFLFYANFVFRGSLAGLAHTWSLAVEEHFYLVWPLAFVVLRRRRVKVLIAVMVAAIVMRLLAPFWEISPGWSYQLTPMRADGLAIGCLAAMIPVEAPGLPALAIAVACFFFVHLENYGMLLVGTTGFALISAAAIRGARSPLLRLRPMQYIGRRSYGLYLYHFPVSLWVDRLHLGAAASICAKVLLALALTEASYRTIERWALMLKERLRSGRGSDIMLADAATTKSL